MLTEDSLLYMLSSRDYGRTPPRGLFNLSNIFRISAVQEQSACRRRKFEFQVHVSAHRECSTLHIHSDFAAAVIMIASAWSLSPLQL